ncbi:hypothetical protein RHMOL_Rhmol12G0239400 [Rhododendron molle]|uniref:Uncharacterized protein n=1 Tax=Rhododendron molle TaxID=49168 RepID=A0ACC0LM16_RHOML|nr:hypothetical protein RHMOL_Rhmol12G0239400 [Rhododendron molle]
MFSPTLRAQRNTDCNRTSRIWVLYEEEVQNMEMDQNLVFNVANTDSHSSDEIYHTPEEDPTPPSTQSVGEPTPPPAQGSSSWWQTAISMFSPHPPLSHTSTHHNSSAHQTPTLFDQHSLNDQPTAVHADTSNPLSFLPLFPPPSQHVNLNTNPAPQPHIPTHQQPLFDQSLNLHANTSNPLHFYHFPLLQNQPQTLQTKLDCHTSSYLLRSLRFFEFQPLNSWEMISW